ncbi:MAG: DUF3891 family protein [Solirubrobacteraceae bacterium]
MLVTRRGGRLVLVTQPDHAALAGRLAERWGNERFAIPAAREALICAAEHHDDGWLELDGLPAYNAQAQRPAHFTELPLSETVGPYGRGVESVYDRDPHAGALVGMHFSGFYTSRWGAGRRPPSHDPIAREVVATQEARWMPALREAWGYRGLRSGFDAATWHAYEVLQAVDLLSLAIALIDLEQTADPGGEALDVAATLTNVDQPAGSRIVTSVPTTTGGEYREITLTPIAPRRLELDPYPFGEPQIEVAVTVRELDDRPYPTAEQASDGFHAAQIGALTVTLVDSAPVRGGDAGS